MSDSCNCIGCEIVKIKDLIRNAIWVSGAQGIVLGISGGIDSAVACALAVKAISAERVTGVSMPIASNSKEDAEDAKHLCDQLGVELLTVPLGKVHAAFLDTENITKEPPVLAGNVAARLRMTALYNIAATKKALVCGTSNRTEYMIGYSTKWGDGAADIQPLLHLYKRDIYRIAVELNIPTSIINKAPSAGFFSGQTDEKEIGLSYEELDTALINLEENGFKPETEIESKVLSMIKSSEHKRNPPANRLYKS